jgi:phage terminase large subunit
LKSPSKIPITKEQRQKARDNAPKHPIEWLKAVFGVIFWTLQQEIIKSVRDNPRTTVRSCHGIGKSHLAGNLILWFLYTHPYSIVLSTAPTYRQVEKLIWKEVRSSLRKGKIRLGGDLARKSPELQIVQDEWVALGLSTNQPDRFQGFHARYILVIVDEAAGVPESILEAIEGVLTSGHCRLLYLGNPTGIGGSFYRSHRDPKAGFKKFHVSAFDTPNFTTYNITEEDISSNAWESKIPKTAEGDFDWPFPYLITPKWAAERYQAWGPNHPAYQARVLGNFPEMGEYNVCPLSWIEKAQALWNDAKAEGSVIIGVDVARGGSDDSAIAVRQGSKILSIEAWHGLDGPELAALAVERYKLHNAKSIHVDSIGVGASVIDSLKKDYPGISYRAINVSVASIVKDEDGNKRFANLKAEMCWYVREAMDPKNPDPLAIPPDEDLLGDLAAPRYSFRKGYIQIEDKEETKARLGRSPDRGEAVLMTFAPAEEAEDPAIVYNIPTKAIAR